MVSDMMQKDKQMSGTTAGFHFAGLSTEETNALRARLSAVAYQLGFVSRRGPLAGRGNASALLVAIANGEAKVTLQDQHQQEKAQGEDKNSSTPAA